ncbi:MAG: hypothetical protein KF760_02545 [Candidatus Eremiobacteraeota bacterium]|nr:hypothetical protein [Candidatus Eremiobacteraeota bacterium]MCW5868795.1 hypothetical protein [Candidatus Eremiobacteraeota bacterium]
MDIAYSAADLAAFEEEIKECYLNKQIRAPIHLRSGLEENLLEIFREVEPQDYVYAYWASHLHCLLKGVPRDQVRQSILDGNSIALCFPQYNVYCSGIASSLAGVATGTALALKRAGASAFSGGRRSQRREPHVWLFTGDMAAECGTFHEAIKYAHHFSLPVTFVVEDNAVSVLTDTRKTWGSPRPWYVDTPYAERIRYFQYSNSYPHSGVSVRVAF